MAVRPTQALRLFAELLDIDRDIHRRKGPPTLDERRRRRAIARDLRAWALDRERQQNDPAKARREHPRAEVRVDVLVAGRKTVCHSLGLGGCSVSLLSAPKLGDVLEVQITTGPDERPVTLQGQVLWYDSKQARAGMRFVTVDAEAEAILERLVYGALIGASGRQV